MPVAEIVWQSDGLSFHAVLGVAGDLPHTFTLPPVTCADNSGAPCAVRCRVHGATADYPGGGAPFTVTESPDEIVCYCVDPSGNESEGALILTMWVCWYHEYWDTVTLSNQCKVGQRCGCLLLLAAPCDCLPLLAAACRCLPLLPLLLLLLLLQLLLLLVLLLLRAPPLRTPAPRFFCRAAATYATDGVWGPGGRPQPAARSGGRARIAPACSGVPHRPLPWPPLRRGTPAAPTVPPDPAVARPP
jgi:hypothetical protein